MVKVKASQSPIKSPRKKTMIGARRVLQNAARSRVVARRNMSIWESGNKVQDKRSKYYTTHTMGAADPTFLKEPSDKIIFGVMSGLCFFGCMNIVSGLYNMSYGVNKL